MVTIFEIAQLTPQELIYQLFLPFILTYVIFFAVLQMISLFNKKINLILSLAITVMIAASPIFAWITSLITQYGAYTALGAFIAVFVIGIGAWTFKRSRAYITGTPEEAHRLENEIKKLREKMERESDPNKRMSMAYELVEKERTLLTLRGRR